MATAAHRGGSNDQVEAENVLATEEVAALQSFNTQADSPKHDGPTDSIMQDQDDHLDDEFKRLKVDREVIRGGDSDDEELVEPIVNHPQVQHQLRARHHLQQMRGANAYDLDVSSDYDPADNEDSEEDDEDRRKGTKRKRRRKACRMSKKPVGGITSSGDPDEPSSVLTRLDLGLPAADTAPGHRPRLGGPLKIETINTNFYHPIIFNYHPKSEDAEPCHFCSEPMFPALGPPLRKNVKVYRHDHNGMSTFSEISRNLAIPNTKICTVCTTARARILTCPGHDFSQDDSIAVVSPEAENEILDGVCDGQHEKVASLCSICINVAVISCTAAQESMLGDEGAQSCGLKLCRVCHSALDESRNGDLSALLQSLDLKEECEGSDERPLGMRADHELLKPDRELALHLKSTSAM